MTILSVSQAMSNAAQAGFSGIAQQIIVAIAEAESSLNPNATGYNPGSVDRGILQINSSAHPEVSDACAYDPICAFKAAFKISNNGTNFSPWTTYTNGSYQQFMGGLPNSSQSSFSWPSWLTSPNITQYYNPPNEYGTDFAVPYGTPVPSLFSGTVVYAGRTQWSSDPNDTSGGAVVLMSDIQGLGKRTYYTLHLDSIANGIQVGSNVVAGQILGLSGGQTSGGNWPANPKYSTGPHIEEGIGGVPGLTFPGGGSNVNPLTYINQALSTTPTSMALSYNSNSMQPGGNNPPPSWMAPGSLGYELWQIFLNNGIGNEGQKIANQISLALQEAVIIPFGIIIIIIGFMVLFFSNNQNRNTQIEMIPV